MARAGDSRAPSDDDGGDEEGLRGAAGPNGGRSESSPQTASARKRSCSAVSRIYEIEIGDALERKRGVVVDGEGQVRTQRDNIAGEERGVVQTLQHRDVNLGVGLEICVAGEEKEAQQSYR